MTETLVEANAPPAVDLLSCRQDSGTSLCSDVQLHTKVPGKNAIPLKSVDTPVAYRPFDATAREPPRSTWERESVVAMQWGMMVIHGKIGVTYPC